jgi:hypothetical protein
MMVGDGPEGQPTEGVESLADIASAMEPQDESAPVESEEGEESDAPEEVEGSEEEEAEEGEDEQQDEKFTIKVDGKDVSLSRAELIEQAQKGFDYTQKTMAVAEERKAVEAVKRDADTLREQNAQLVTEQIQRLQALEQFMQSQLGEPPPISLAQHDAHQYLLQKEVWEARKGQLHQVVAGIQQLQGEQARQRQAWINQKSEATEKALRDTLTGWNDNTLTELADYADKNGLHPNAAGEAMLEPGFWQLVQKAKAYDAIQAKKAELKPKAQLAKVATPKASNPIPRGIVAKQAAEKQYRAKPSLNNLAALID